MYSTFYYPLRRFLCQGGQDIHRYWRELERLQWLSRSELEARQLGKIQQVVSYAYEHIPFYREHYKREDIHPQDIKCWKDFQALPFITKEEINKNLEALVSPEMRNEVVREQTSGSTGNPMRFYVSPSEWWLAHAHLFRSRAWYGVRPGDKIAWFWGGARTLRGKDWKSRLKRERYLNAFHMTESRMQDFAVMLQRWKPKMFFAYPSALTLFARHIQKQGLTGIKPRFVQCAAERLTLAEREFFEDIFGCQVANLYGSWELKNVADECPDGGLHVVETRHLEIVANDQVVQPGEMGEIVVTSLTQFAMPFIRYRTDDMGVYETEDCTCGRGMPVLREVLGRTSDFLVTPEGNYIHPMFFGYIFRVREEVTRYQVYQPDREHLEVRLLCGQEVGSDWLEKVRREVQTCFGDTMQISINLVDRFELSPTGKHHIVISDVKPDFI